MVQDMEGKSIKRLEHGPSGSSSKYYIKLGFMIQILFGGWFDEQSPIARDTNIDSKVGFLNQMIWQSAGKMNPGWI